MRKRRWRNQYLRRPQARRVARRKRACLMCLRVFNLERAQFICDECKRGERWQAGGWP
jgi:hypothetical protein